ncbi:ATP-binding cassette domain-containing protein [uncultured Stenotrophomonas sp.]|uniref:ATP-binding cassette domain-containing protein n=1 Tax=uncultured Stenotrophomonas sp. TaxID=165438 RepID=UPI0025FF6279|nr:ATP-binding cassette domain-containing protein [uncultured Stenotrophomonas sp.]
MTQVDAGARPRTAAALLDLEHLVVKQGSFTLSLGNLQLMPGTRMGIVGRNGCGKTTLLEAAIGLREPAQVRGRLFGTELPSAIGRPDVRRRMGCQLQSTRFSRHVTVPELLDLHLALYGRGNDRLMSALRLDELGGLRGGLLSRGQRQRLELYMALAHGPEIVMLDEPFTGLDRRFCDALLRFMRDDLPRECAVMVVGHSEEELSLVDEVAWLQDGALLDRGTSADLIARHAGSVLLRLRFHRAEQLLQASALLSGLSGVHCWQDTEHLQLTLCGDDAMVDGVVAACPPQDLRSWEQSRSSVTDLVRLGQRRTVSSGERERTPCLA